jgi:hypothetical protein
MRHSLGAPAGWLLEDAEAMASFHPETFVIPPDEARMSLGPGDLAKLVFLTDDPEMALGERMWVVVEDAVGPGEYIGTLLDNPAVLDAPLQFDEVFFEARHVADIQYVEPPTPTWEENGAAMSGVFDVFRKKGPEPEPEKPKRPFEVFRKPEEAAPPGLPPPPGALIVPAMPPTAVRPFEAVRPTGLPALPRAARPFEVVRPAEAKPELPAVFRPFAAPPAPIVPPEALLPAIPAAAEPFRALAPAAPPPEALPAIVREIPRAFAPLAPEAPPPPVPRTIEEAFVPPPEPGRPPEKELPPEEAFKPFVKSEEEEIEAKRTPGARKGAPPSVETLEAIFRTWNLEEMWKFIRTVMGPKFRRAIVRAQDIGEPDFELVHTITYSYGSISEQYMAVADYFEIPPEDVAGWIEPIMEAEEKGDDPYEEWEEFNENFVMPLYGNVTEAFGRLKPPDIPGMVVVGDWHDQLAVGYYEEPTAEDRREATREEEVEKKDVRKTTKATQEKFEQDLKNWGPPNKREIKRWTRKTGLLERIYAMARLARKTPQFDRDLREYGRAQEIALEIAPYGDEDVYEDAAAGFFGLPEYVVSAFRDAGLSIVDEVVTPLAAAVIEALDDDMPDDLAKVNGGFQVGWNYDNQSWGFLYVEETES